MLRSLVFDAVCSMRSENVPELTRISSKGQVVITYRVRQKLGIDAGSVFAILSFW